MISAPEGLNIFMSDIKKVKSPRKHKIKNSLGVLSCYKWIKDNKIYLGLKLTSKQFSSIIRAVNKEIGNNLINQKSIMLPYRMGTLELRKNNTKVFFDKDDKLINTNPIDWYSTLKLWYEDEESKESKKVVKMEEKEIFRLHYNKVNANFKNKSYFFIKFNRDLKSQLKQIIKKGTIDAYPIY
jgi:hypothetical protein